MFLILFFILFLFLRLIYVIIQQNYGRSADMINRLKRDLLLIYPNIHSLKINSGRENFTKNKKEIYLSLTDVNGRFYNYNSLIYIAIHELAHIICPEYGHTYSFYQIHKGLLEDAIKKGIYNHRLPSHHNICII